MIRGHLIWITAIGVLFAQNVSAGDACLQHNRAKNWRAVDDSTLVYTDVRFKDYTVKFRGTCRNLTRGNAVLVNRHWSGLSCLSRGDSFRVAAPGLPASTCVVDTVTAGSSMEKLGRK
jgi:hypothetical protein